jgi:hypothetical protein
MIAVRKVWDPVTAVGRLIARMSLRESAFLDELWITRNPQRFGAFPKRRHRQSMCELLGYYTYVCEDFLECELPGPAAPFMDLVIHEVVRFAMDDPFLARPPYFPSDLIHVRQRRYLRAIDHARSKLKLMPTHVRAEWRRVQPSSCVR